MISNVSYYFVVTVCGNNIALPSDAKYNQLSGIITSTSTPHNPGSLESCDTVISNLPKGEVTMRIELLDVAFSGKKYSVSQDTVSTKLKPKEPMFISITSQQLTFMYRSEEHTPNAFFFQFQGKTIFCWFTIFVDSVKG